MGPRMLAPAMTPPKATPGWMSIVSAWIGGASR